MRFCLSLGLVCLLPLTALASEVDDFTAEYLEIRDSTPEWNRRLNEGLRETVNEVNQANRLGACPKIDFYRKFSNRFGAGYFFSVLEKWPAQIPEIHSVIIPYFESVYLGSNVAGREGSPIAQITQYIGFQTPEVQVAGIKMGVDKIGHFFATGYQYFTLADLMNDPDFYAPGTLRGMAKRSRGEDITKRDQSAAELGENEEGGLYGRYSTGIYSHGDLAANFDGLRMWRDFFEGDSPMLACKGDKIEIVRDFAIEQYVTPAWNEAINCSEFNSPEITEKIYENVRALERKHGEEPVGCRATPPICRQLVAHYGKVAEKILHPNCVQMGRN